MSAASPTRVARDHAVAQLDHPLAVLGQFGIVHEIDYFLGRIEVDAFQRTTKSSSEGFGPAYDGYTRRQRRIGLRYWFMQDGV